MIEVIILDRDLYGPADIMPKTLGSAGLDLKLTRDAKSAAQIAAEGGVWPYHDLISTGLRVRVPTNMVGFIVPRSSTGHKQGFKLGNTLGIIDSDFRGELLLSIGGGDYSRLKRGAVVAQLILVPYSSFYGASIVDEFSDADTAYGQGCRGDGGFGSTDAQAGPALGAPSIAAVEELLLQSREWAELSPTQRGLCVDARREAGCQQIDEYNAMSRLNGGF